MCHAFCCYRPASLETPERASKEGGKGAACDVRSILGVCAMSIPPLSDEATFLACALKRSLEAARRDGDETKARAAVSECDFEDVVLAAIAYKYVHVEMSLRAEFFVGFGILAGRADFVAAEAKILHTIDYRIPRETRYHLLIEECAREGVFFDRSLVDRLLWTEQHGVADANRAVRACLDGRLLVAKKEHEDQFSTPLTSSKRPFDALCCEQRESF